MCVRVLFFSNTVQELTGISFSTLFAQSLNLIEVVWYTSIWISLMFCAGMTKTELHVETPFGGMEDRPSYGSPDRPKTSRGVQSPSPDQFTR